MLKISNVADDLRRGAVTRQDDARSVPFHLDAACKLSVVCKAVEQVRP